MTKLKTPVILNLIFNFILIFTLIGRLVFSGEIKDKEGIIHLLMSKNSADRYQALEKLKGSSIDEQIYQRIGQILLEEKKHFGEIRLACEILGEDKNITPQRKVKLLLNALQKQIYQPDFTIEEGMYVPNFEAFKRQYIFAIEKIGIEAVPVLKDELTTSSIVYRDYIYIILGTLKQTEVYENVANILNNAKDGWIRASAARSLGLIGNKEAIPLLKEVLDDPFMVKSSTYTGNTNSDIGIIYPVREEASSALRLLGKRVKRIGHKFWIEE